MNILIPILKKDETWKQHKEKFNEECAELHNELTRAQFLEQAETVDEKQIGMLVEEAMDVIQMCVGIIYKALEVNRQVAIAKIEGHIVKLINRGWKTVSILKVNKN